MTGPLNSTKKKDEINNEQVSADACRQSERIGPRPLKSTKRMDEIPGPEREQTPADVFSEQLALQVAALVREVAARHEVLLRRQLLEEKDTVSALRCDDVALHRKPDIRNADSQDSNFVANNVPPPPDATCNIATTSMEANKVTQERVNGAYSDCAQFHQQCFDVPRLQQSERAWETPAYASEDGPPSAYSGGTDEIMAQFAQKKNKRSLSRSFSTQFGMVTPLFGNKEGKKMKGLLQTRFNELDCRRTGRLNAENLRSCVQILDGQEEAALDGCISEAIEAFNKANTRFQPQSTNLQELTFEGFFYLMTAENCDRNIGAEEVAVLTDIRTVVVNEVALEIIAMKSMVSTNDITGEHQTTVVCSRMMEPVSGFVICINALCIGLQLDIATGWMGWQVAEVLFTCFFISELALKIRYSGFVEMFFGDDWRWNLFDTLIVILAALDMCFWVGKLAGWEGDLNLRNVSIMRLSRLMRITRVVRLLKLNFFKDLTIMINGVLGGLKTLFWAFVLLFTIIYVVGIMLRQVIVGAKTDCVTSSCTPAEQHLAEFEGQLFSNCFRSMFTVFRCLVDGCSSADGTPLILYFWDAHGWMFVLVYVFVFMFILFGVFNLIMAIFVEKTLEYAKLDTAKRREARYKEEVRIAKDFRALVLKICAHQQGGNLNRAARKTTSQQNVDTFKSGFRYAIGGASALNKDDQADMDNARIPTPSCQLTISREDFDHIMDDEDIRGRMEDLEISVTSSAKLFDILDSNGSGVVDVVELTEGLMSLRGPADKGDLISGTLLVRSTQKMVKDMQEEMTKCIQNQNCQLELLHQLDANFKSRVTTGSSWRLFAA